MQFVRNLLMGVAGALLLSACAPSAKSDPAADSAAVRAVTKAWFDAYTAGDAAGTAAVYADDAVVSPPGVAPLRSREAILEYFTRDIAMIKSAGLTFNNDPTTDAGASGDLAWEMGGYTVSDAAGNAVDRGSFTTVFARRDGGWKIIRDTWNSSNAPAPGGSGAALRIVHFTAASAKAQEEAMALVDAEIQPLYARAQGLQWVKFFRDTKSLETGSVSLWSGAEDAAAFLQSEGYKPIPGKLKPLMRGAMVSKVLEVREPAK